MTKLFRFIINHFTARATHVYIVSNDNSTSRNKGKMEQYENEGKHLEHELE